MQNQKCPNCSASMIVVTNEDGTNSYACEYCGNVIRIQPKSASDKIFAFVNRVINALDDNKRKSPISTEKQEEFDARLAAINEKRQKAYEKYQNKRQQEYEKYQEKRLKKYEKYVDKRLKK